MWVIVTTGKVMSMEQLSAVQGRAWDDIDVSLCLRYLILIA